MGLIAGIFTHENNSELNHKLMDMINCQSHRGSGNPVKIVRENYALGMLNQHNSIFCDSKEEDHIASFSQDNISNINAFVDGVVLDIQKHQQYFESIGFSIPFPTCSAIVSTAYEKWGIGFMNHLDGDFSCAIWDKKSKLLILARDPLGKKPLHYYKNDNQLVFSSEIKGIIKSGIKPHINLVGLSDFLSLNCIPYPGTIFKDIMQVPPGSMLIYDRNNIKIQRYWYHKIKVDESISLEQAVYEMTGAIKNSVKKRMVTNDTYCFLSGGVDSSAVLSFASELSNKPIHAVTAGFAEEEFNELDDAALMARHVGAVHHPVIATPDSFFDMLDVLVSYHDGPFTDTSAYPTYYAAKLARSFTDIILSGDGPDQILCGSGHHVFAARKNSFSERNMLIRWILGCGAYFMGRFMDDPTPSFLSKIQRRVHRDSLSPVHAAYDLRSFFPDIVKYFLCTDDLWDVHVHNNPYRHPESWFKEAEGLDDINKYLFADMKFYVTDDLMIKVDRMCMANGLETLSPFLDTSFSEIANKLPGRYKLRKTDNGEFITKYILKKICQDRFPPALLKKKKQGFGIPLDKWIKHDHGKYVRDILLDPRTLNRGYFKKKSIEKLLDVLLNNQGDYFFPTANGVVGLLTLELWHRRYLD